MRILKHKINDKLLENDVLPIKKIFVHYSHKYCELSSCLPPRAETQRNELIKHFHSTEKSDGKLARR